MVGAAGGSGSTRRRSSAAISRPRASAVRSTCLGSTGTAANSCMSALPSTKLTIAPTRPTMRVTAGESDESWTPNARSRGQKPASHTSQW